MLLSQHCRLFKLHSTLLEPKKFACVRHHISVLAAKVLQYASFTGGKAVSGGGVTSHELAYKLTYKRAVYLFERCWSERAADTRCLVAYQRRDQISCLTSFSGVTIPLLFHPIPSKPFLIPTIGLIRLHRIPPAVPV